ncbi:MAG TPA: glycosyltransferase family 39 protein [Anaerolineales bacterium]|nr:glycosyltransferase family 39 protein [Anaerolineales bacterium]HNC08539.1 glycosyltransferase family 39 protein [Anaerolineales bacterium]
MPVPQRNLASCLLIGGAALAIFGQITQIARPEGQRVGAVILMALGLVFYLAGILIARNEKANAAFERILGRPAAWLTLEVWQVVCLIIAVLLSILAQLAAGEADTVYSSTAVWVTWFGAIAFGLAGCWKPNPLDVRAHWKTIAYFSGFTILAFLARGIATDRVPIILYGDEASAGIFGDALLKGTFNNPFSVGWYAFPGLYFYIPAASISMLGYTTAALRIPSAIAGALTVGATYLTGRFMFDRRTAAIAAIVLTGFHFHIHFSRIGLNNVWDGLFFVLVIGAAWYGWEHENRNAYILAGLGIGLAQYFYPSSRVILAVVMGGFFVSGLFSFQKLKRSLANIFLMLFTGLVIFLPMGWYYVKNPNQFLAPMERVSILGPWLDNEILITGKPAWQILLKQLMLGAQSFTYLPLQHWYRPEVALLRPISAGIFLLGLIYLISRPKESRSIILIIWLAMYIFIGGLSESTPASQRYVAAAPVCILILAVGISETGTLFEKLWKTPERIVTAVMIGLAVFVSAEDANFYFNKYTKKSNFELAGTNGMIAQDLANDLLDKPKGTQAFFFIANGMGYYAIPSIPYLAHNVEGFDVGLPWGAAENPVPSSDHLIFIFLPASMNDLPVIQEAYPNGTLHEKTDIQGDTLYWLYEYNAGQ